MDGNTDVRKLFDKMRDAHVLVERGLISKSVLDQPTTNIRMFSAGIVEQYSQTSGSEVMDIMREKQYLVILERTERNYGAYSPDLPGCVATGKTAEDTLRLMREAIELHVRGLEEDGLPVPEPTSTASYVSVAV